MDKKIKVVIAEDQELMRKALISLLEEDQRIRIIAEAENGKKLMEVLLKSRHDQPDIVLLDLEMPVMNGKESLELIRKKYSKVKTIILSVHHEEAIMLDMMTSGASAYLSKGCSASTLFEAIHTVHKEGAFFDKDTSRAMFSGLLKRSVNPLFDEHSLSKRETEIVQELCKGKTNKEVAAALNITTSTVDFHKGNIYKKTKSKNMADLVRYAIKNKIIDG